MPIFRILLLSLALLLTPARAGDNPPRRPDPAPLRLSPGARVFFVGDSLMVGIAPYLRDYFQRYDIVSIDRSRESSGLVNEQRLDWPRTVAETFATTPDISLMLVLIGANDPKDMGALKYRSPAWEAEYRRRLQSLVDTARRHHAQILWLEIPPMRAPAFNADMAYLNGLLRRFTADNQIPLVATAQLLGADGLYHEQLNDEQLGSVAIRAPDGIHFTKAGYWYLAERLWRRYLPVGPL